jgi:site-specific DNA-cytosine methylase
MSETNEPKWATMVPLIGGSAFGCHKATGTKPLYNMSYTPFAANESFFYRHWNEVPVFLIDEGNDPKESFPEQLDFVNSVCPCAGLSQLSTAKSGSDARAAQNKWMFEGAHYVLGHVKPRVYWGENAPALFTNSGKDVRDQLREIADEHGYSFSLYKTSTSKHGAPQHRDRTFYFFWDSEHAPIMNWYNRPMPELEDFLNQVPPHASGQDEFVSNKDPNASLIKRFVHQKTMLCHEEFIKVEGNSKKPKHSYWRWLEKHDVMNECLDWIANKYGTGEKDYKRLFNAKAKLDAGKNYMVPGPFFFDKKVNAMVGRTITSTLHPTKERYLNVREVMHLMGMPHNFEFSPSESGAALNMLAQNVPVYTARDMAQEVMKFIRGELDMSEQSFLMQNNHKQKSV